MRSRPPRVFVLCAALLSSVCTFAPAADPPAVSPPAAPAWKSKSVLFFTKSSGFQHSVITRKSAEELGWAEKILTDTGKQNGFDVTCSKDGDVFTPENLARYDAFAFYTTGDLTKPSDKYSMKKGPDGKNNVQDKLIHTEKAMTPEAKAALIQAVKDGKGFIAFHCGSDTFHSSKKGELLRDTQHVDPAALDPYIAMLGGEFITHGAQQKAAVKVVDPAFPGLQGLEDQRVNEEWYALKNFAPDLHVILVMETQGMNGAMYQRQPFPETWARAYGKGRVFYTSLGHREDVWTNPKFTQVVLAGLNWITGNTQADVTPNIDKVTPQAEVAGQEPKK